MSNLARLKHYSLACVGSRTELRSANGDFRKMRKGEARELLNMFSKNELNWTLHIAVLHTDEADRITSMTSVGYKVNEAVYQDELTDFVQDRCWELREEEGGQDLLTGWFITSNKSVTEISDELAFNTYLSLHGYRV